MSSGAAIGVMLIVLVVSIGVSVARASSVADRAEEVGEDRRHYFWRAFNSHDRRSLEEMLEVKGRLRAAEQRAAADRRRLKGMDAVGPAKPIAPATPRTPAERLQDLQDLYRQGLINEDEFATKRREILGDV